MKTLKCKVSDYMKIKEFRLTVQEPNAATNLNRICEPFKVRSSRDAASFFVNTVFFNESDRAINERFYILLLNQQNRIVGFVKISEGGIAGTVVEPSIILKYAIDSLSKGLILCHNHPSGNPQPSEADLKITQRIKTAASLLEINVLDHLIISGDDTDKYHSMADEGQL